MSIKSGDLVVVTKPTPCCGNGSTLGAIFRVQKIKFGIAMCGYCRKEIADSFAQVGPHHFRNVYRLRRIDPLPESETQDNHESLDRKSVV